MTANQHRRRAGARRLFGPAALLAAVALGGCSTQSSSSDSTVAKPVPPPAASDRPAARTANENRTPGRPTTSGTSKGSGGPAAAPAPPSRPDEHRILSSADRTSFARLAASLGGGEGLAVSAIGPSQDVERVGSIDSVIAWSTSKVPIAMAVIDRGAGREQQANLRAAITASDNQAAMRLWASLGGGNAAAQAADEQLRDVGDTHTSVESRTLRAGGYTPFGQTRWSLTDQTRFTAGMPCTQAGAEVLGLMNSVVAAQRWGLGAAGVDAQLKGGWGPGSQPGRNGGYLDRQMGVLTIDRKPIAVAIAAEPSDGSHETGIRNLNAITRWLVAHANVKRLPTKPGC